MLAVPRPDIDAIVDVGRYPLADGAFRTSCRDALARDGCVVLPGFLAGDILAGIRREALENRHLAYYCAQRHNVYLTPPDGNFSPDHPRNRNVTSSKGCITDDQVPADSALRTLYESRAFRDFLCAVLGERALYEYADPLSSINIHYANDGQELGWHFDNSSFAITLLVQRPDGGGAFQYLRDLRDSGRGDMNFEGVREVLDGERPPQELSMHPGTLVLFRGRDSMHRVTPVTGDTPRILVVLAYNSEPGIALSESARLTFYGRLD
jgi:hypothetical protein